MTPSRTRDADSQNVSGRTAEDLDDGYIHEQTARQVKGLRLDVSVSDSELEPGSDSDSELT